MARETNKLRSVTVQCLPRSRCLEWKEVAAYWMRSVNAMQIFAHILWSLHFLDTYCWQTWIPGFSEMFSNCHCDLLWSFWILPEWLTRHKTYNWLHRMWAIIDLTKDVYVYSFVCGKEVSVYEKKVACLQMTSCFKLAMLDPVQHFIMGYLSMCITYPVRLHTAMYVL
jgi:hypothetical protein